MFHCVFREDQALLQRVSAGSTACTLRILRRLQTPTLRLALVRNRQITLMQQRLRMAPTSPSCDSFGIAMAFSPLFDIFVRPTPAL